LGAQRRADDDDDDDDDVCEELSLSDDDAEIEVAVH
jgi:hypothetical protein